MSDMLGQGIGALLPGKGNEMTRLSHWRSALVCLASVFLLAITAGAQQRTQGALPRALVYDPAREVSIQGTVISYTANTSAPPHGPHVTLQTSSGVLDVHLGNAAVLVANNITLNQGDAVRVIGENVTFGTGMQFVARLIQKGNQAVLLRSARGFPLRPTLKAEANKVGGAL